MKDLNLPNTTSAPYESDEKRRMNSEFVYLFLDIVFSLTVELEAVTFGTGAITFLNDRRFRPTPLVGAPTE